MQSHIILPIWQCSFYFYLFFLYVQWAQYMQIYSQSLNIIQHENKFMCNVAAQLQNSHLFVDLLHAYSFSTVIQTGRFQIYSRKKKLF